MRKREIKRGRKREISRERERENVRERESERERKHEIPYACMVITSPYILISIY